MGKNGINDKDFNDSFLKKTSMNINEVNERKAVDKAKNTENIAFSLVEKFKAPKCYNFFLKCAWRLSENFIWTTYEVANAAKIKSPVKYFVKACANEMKK